MDFSWNEEQQALKDRIIEFAQAELNDDVLERDQQGRFSGENWQKCADFGILGLAASPDYGGKGLDILSSMYAMEGLGFASRDNGLNLGLNAQMWTVQLPHRAFWDSRTKRTIPTRPDLW